MLSWVVFLVVVLGLILHSPYLRTVTPVYFESSSRFFAGLPLYDLNSVTGFLYLPAFVILFTPFRLLGEPLGSALWSLTASSVLTLAAYRQARSLSRVSPMPVLSLALLIALPLSAGAIRNGQATALMMGAAWLAILAATEQRRLPVFFWSAVALICKPLAIVPLLLIAGVFPFQLPALAATLLLVLALPYVFAPSTYINELYHSFILLMHSIAPTGGDQFASTDFTALLKGAGLIISDLFAIALRTIVAGLILLAARVTRYRFAAGEYALWLMLLASLYMTVFNPRAESNTYALLALPLAMLLSAEFYLGRSAAWACVLGAVVFFTGMTGVFRELHEFTEFWFRPLTLSVVAALSAWVVLRSYVTENNDNH